MRVLMLGTTDMFNWEPWGRNTRDAVARAHDISILDPSRSLVDQVGDPAVEIIVDQTLRASPALAEAAAGHVQLWQLGSVGYDHLDLRSLVRFGIPTANCPGFTSSRALAEEALMLAMMVLRRFPEVEAHVEARLLELPVGLELAGRTLLIVGLGASGREMAKRAVAFGMKVIAIQRRPDPELTRRYGIRWIGGLDDFDDAIARADVISLHVPLTDETRNMMSAERLRLMKPGSIIVNVSRGGLIDEEALAAEIRGGRIYGAGLDVVLGEPIGPDHPLRGMRTVVMTPHIAGGTDGTSRRRSRFAAINISRVAYGLEPLCRIDTLPSQG
jgi:phosphoglycerate dehydrogenase-like enzyme